MIKDLEKAIKGSESLVFVNFHGLKVSDETKLRRELRDKEVNYKVSRKTLLARALKGKAEGEVPELAGEVAACLGGKNAVLIRNHGPVCCGRNLEEALVTCQVVEKAAACYLSIKDKFSVHVIPDDMVAKERDRFLNHYGREN